MAAARGNDEMVIQVRELFDGLGIQHRSRNYYNTHCAPQVLQLAEFCDEFGFSLQSALDCYLPYLGEEEQSLTQFIELFRLLRKNGVVLDNEKFIQLCNQITIQFSQPGYPLTIGINPGIAILLYFNELSKQYKETKSPLQFEFKLTFEDALAIIPKRGDVEEKNEGKPSINVNVINATNGKHITYRLALEDLTNLYIAFKTEGIGLRDGNEVVVRLRLPDEKTVFTEAMEKRENLFKLFQLAPDHLDMLVKAIKRLKTYHFKPGQQLNIDMFEILLNESIEELKQIADHPAAHEGMEWNRFITKIPLGYFTSKLRLRNLVTNIQQPNRIQLLEESASGPVVERDENGEIASFDKEKLFRQTYFDCSFNRITPKELDVLFTIPDLADFLAYVQANFKNADDIGSTKDFAELLNRYVLQHVIPFTIAAKTPQRCFSLEEEEKGSPALKGFFSNRGMCDVNNMRDLVFGYLTVPTRVKVPAKEVGIQPNLTKRP